MTVNTFWRSTLLLGCIAGSLVGQPTVSLDQRVADLVARMTLEEKVSLLGGTGFDTRPIERLGIPTLRMTDGPLGVRTGRATAFPSSIALAASWDTALVRRVGEALGRETKAKDKNVLLAPCVNIHRVPHGGRNFESFGEDPFVAARMAVAYITGVQSEGVAATVKHFAVNNQEHERDFVDARVSERALREIYLPAFEASVLEADVLAVMNSYNRLNGPYTTQHAHLNLDILKNEWGFRGVLMSDWGATHSVAQAANGGLDLEMPTGKHFGDSLLTAVRSGEVREAVIDDHVTRIVRLALKDGIYQASPKADTSVILSRAHQMLNREAAARGMVLLKNDGPILPFDRSTLKSLAVIGPNADILRTGGGGSSMVSPTSAVSPLAAIREAAPRLDVRFAQGVKLEGDLIPIDPAQLTPGGGMSGKGWKAEYFDNMRLAGKPKLTRVEPIINHDWVGDSPDKGIPSDQFSARWTATLRPDVSGERRLEVSSDDGIRLWLDGQLLIEDWTNHAEIYKSVPVQLEAGKAYELKIEYYEDGGSAVARCGWSVNQEGKIAEAAETARGADAAVLFVGYSARYESEGFDRPDLTLSDEQVALIKAVTAANPRTAVVLHSGAAVLMEDWVSDVPALIEAWYPGQEGGHAIAQVLFGDVNPSGKLTTSFLKRWEDYSSFGTYPNETGVANYTDDIFVGYRHVDRTGMEPRFAFGHGLSYTTFGYENLSVKVMSSLPSPRLEVTFDVINTGSRAGAEVSQVYVSNPAGEVERPRQELRGFARVDLAPGERRTVRLELGPRAFSTFDASAGRWTVPPGDYGIRVGSSSRLIRFAEIATLR
ncbi:MAG: glycoside hydrolase family 3 C-terminal domain-containing protein [Bacteroidetes bacterium]|nr:glycoside hydrolase family 3 C-terminal domain-containing protein [Bacteroidota bacterium]